MRELAAIADRLDSIEGTQRAQRAEQVYPRDRAAESRVVAALVDSAGKAQKWRALLLAPLLEEDMASLIFSEDLRAVGLAAVAAARENVEATRGFIVSAIVGAGTYVPKVHELVTELERVPAVCSVDRDLSRLRALRRRRAALVAIEAAARELRDEDCDVERAHSALAAALEQLEALEGGA